MADKGVQQDLTRYLVRRCKESNHVAPRQIRLPADVHSKRRLGASYPASRGVGDTGAVLLQASGSLSGATETTTEGSFVKNGYPSDGSSPDGVQ